MTNTRIMHMGLCAASTIAATAIAADALGAAVTVTRVAYQGQVVSYNSNTVTLGTLNSPYTNGLGQVGFTGSATVAAKPDPIATHFVWYNNGITWLNINDTSATVTGTETTSGISNTGGFIHSPSYNGGDSVYTHNGKLLADPDPHPALPGLFSAFNSRPVMMPDGTAYWIGGYSNTPGGATAGRVFLKCTDTSDPNTITKILQSGDFIDGLAIGSTGLGFAFDVADNNNHWIITALVGAATATDDRVLVNGATVAQAGSTTGSGDNWAAAATFTNTSINNSGNYIFTGTSTSASPANRAFVYNGSVVLRGGNTLDGLTLGTAVNAASINNFNRVVHTWSTTSPTNEVLYYGRACNLTASKIVLTVGQEIDYTGDGNADATIQDLLASNVVSLGLSLSDHNYVYVEASLRDIGQTTNYEAIIKVPLPFLTDCPADVNGDCAVNVTDLLAIIGEWNASGFTFADVNNDGQVNVNDLLDVIGGWGPCP